MTERSPVATPAPAPALSSDHGPGRWMTALFRPRDVAALVAFRVVLGLLVAVSGVRFLAYGWVDELFTRSRFRFTYWGFDWVPALPAPWIHVLFGAWVVLGLAVAAGLFYRVSLTLLFVAFAWVQLIDVTNYLNHYYLVTLLLGLMFFVPAHRAFSLDVLREPSLRVDALPSVYTYALRFQVAVVYVFAGLAKLSSDWLLHAQPLHIWLSARTHLPLVGPFLDERWVAYVAAWSGFLFDTFVVAFLLFRRTRPFAYVVVLGFHAATSVLFPIGMFPAIMVAAALVFFDASWPRAWAGQVRALLGKLRGGAKSPGAVSHEMPVATARAIVPPEGPWVRVAFTAAGLYAVLQLLLPLRTHLYGGDVSWHEQGMRFSWRVMTREKNGSVTFRVRDAVSGRQWEVAPKRYLTRLQEREMSSQPDLLLQLAHRIAKDFDAPGRRIEVRADAWVSLNGRPAARLVDPDVDLARIDEGLLAKAWVMPAPTTSPIVLRPAVAQRR